MLTIYRMKLEQSVQKGKNDNMEIEENNSNGNLEMETENTIQQRLLENEFSCLRMVDCIIVIYQKYDDITDELNRKFRT